MFKLEEGPKKMWCGCWFTSIFHISTGSEPETLQFNSIICIDEVGQTNKQSLVVNSTFKVLQHENSKEITYRSKNHISAAL